MTKSITWAISGASKNKEKGFFGNMIKEIPLELTSGVKKIQTFAVKNLLSQGKNMNIDPKKRIINITEDVTIAKNATMARKNLNS